MPSSQPDTDLQRHFAELTELLRRHQTLWTESAFTRDELSWPGDHPRLHRSLLDLTEPELERVEGEAELLGFFSSHFPELEMMARHPTATATPLKWNASEEAACGIPERKRAQIDGFVSAILGSGLRLDRDSRVVDWCSGKAFLARALHDAAGAAVLCLERDAQLHQARVPQKIRFLAHDVLEPLDRSCLQGTHLHTALHACGDLHLSMLRQTAGAAVPALACSPCCYHFTTETIYRGFSQQARGAGLYPTSDELRLATAETCTANSLDRELRHRELLWRVAFDLHLRDLRGIDAYSRAPSVRKSLLKADFHAFARSLVTALERQGRRDFDFRPLSQRGEAALMERARAKLSRLRRLEKVQLVFREPLERWLLLDRALFLQEHGYRVRIQRFCDKHQSGRNQVILAVR